MSLKIEGKALLQVFCIFLAISYLGFKMKQSAVLRSCIQQAVLLLLSPSPTQQEGKEYSLALYTSTELSKLGVVRM